MLASQYILLTHKLKGMPYAEAYIQAMHNQYLAPEDLRKLAALKLIELTKYAAEHVPFYTGRSLDFKEWPLLSKREVFESENSLIAPINNRGVSVCVTSGSSGTPLRFRQDSVHQAWSEACWDRANAWWGIPLGSRQMVLWGRPVSEGTDINRLVWWKHRFKNVFLFNTFSRLKPDYLESLVKAMRVIRPKILYGYGSSIGALASYMHKMGLKLDDRPTLIRYTADHMTPAEKLAATEVFGAPVTSLYASSEASSLAYECPAGKLHISVDQIHVEFIRPDLTPAGPGEFSEIVVTPLNNYCMPLIRYRLGDMGSFSRESCSCGIKLPVMNLEVGRMAEQIETRDGQGISSWILAYISKSISEKNMPGIRLFQVEQIGLEKFRLHLVKAEPFNARTVDYFKLKMSEYLGSNIQIDVIYREDIPVQASGKRSWFVKSI